MSTLTQLSNEVLTIIFHHLGSIDDVHHLARTCRLLSKIIQGKDQSRIYKKIMRSVIINAPHHRFDIQLCRMLDHHAEVVRHFVNGGQAPSPNSPELLIQRPVAEVILNKTELDGSCEPEDILSDEHVCDILARWQGLRFLQDLWLARELGDSDYLPVNPKGASAAADFVSNRDTLRGLSHSGRRTRSDVYTSFKAYQQERFHATVTKLWLLNEIRWNLCCYAYPGDPSIPFTWALHELDRCKEKLDAQIITPVLDHLDLYAVYAFLYQHLLPLHSSVLADRPSAWLPLTYGSDELDKPQGAESLLTCHKAAQVYLQPADIIELVVRHLQPCNGTPLRFPKSARSYLIPYNPTNRRVLQSRNVPLTHISTRRMEKHVLLMLDLRTYAQSARHPSHPSLGQPPHPLLPIPAFVPLDDAGAKGGFFERQVLQAFYKNCPCSTKDYVVIINDQFQAFWATVSWKVWWWANSEDKARAQMERWCRDRRGIIKK